MVNSDSSPSWTPTIGERVVVAWGLEEVEGEIVNVYGLAHHERVVVALVRDGHATAETVVLPAEAVRPIADAPPLEPGHWRTEADLLRVISSKLRKSFGFTNIQISPRLSSGRRPDIVLTTANDLTLIIEAKSIRHAGALAIEHALNNLLSYMSEYGEKSRGLLLFTEKVRDDSITQYVKTLNPGDRQVAVTYWRNPEDDQRLINAIRPLLMETSDEDQGFQILPADSGGWDVVEPAGDRVTYHFRTQREAIEHARQALAGTGGEVRVHSTSGKIRRVHP